MVFEQQLRIQAKRGGGWGRGRIRCQEKRVENRKDGAKGATMAPFWRKNADGAFNFTAQVKRIRLVGSREGGVIGSSKTEYLL